MRVSTAACAVVIVRVSTEVRRGFFVFLTDFFLANFTIYRSGSELMVNMAWSIGSSGALPKVRARMSWMRPER